MMTSHRGIDDPPRMDAALDMSDYVNSDSFEYADTLQQAKAQLAAQ